MTVTRARQNVNAFEQPRLPLVCRFIKRVDAKIQRLVSPFNCISWLSRQSPSTLKTKLQNNPIATNPTPIKPATTLPIIPVKTPPIETVKTPIKTKKIVTSSTPTAPTQKAKDVDSKTLLHPKRPLKFEQIRLTEENNEAIKQIAAIAAIWSKVAREKGNLATNPDEKSRFSSNSSISQSIEWSTRYKDTNGQNSRIFVCRDRALNQVQAIAMTSDLREWSTGSPYLYIDWLATNPINIRSKVNDKETSRIEGAATALIHHIAEICLEEGKDEIALTSVSSAKRFYTKIGFESKYSDGSSFFLKMDKFLFSKTAQTPALAA